MILVLPLISSPSASLFSRLLRTVPRIQATIGTTITLKFHCFFSPLVRSMYLSSFSIFNGLLVFQSLIKFHASYFLGQILVCGYTIYQHVQILVTCTILNGSSCPPSHADTCIPFVQVFSIHLLWVTVSSVSPCSLHLLFSWVNEFWFCWILNWRSLWYSM